MSGSITRILVVDDYEPWRSFYSTAIGKQPALQIIGETSNGWKAVQRAQELQPDLILLDIGLPTLNGIEAARRIRNVSPGSKIILVSEYNSAGMVAAAFSNGAGGYVVKAYAQFELLPAIKAVLEGERFISAAVAAHALGNLETGAPQGGHRTHDNSYLRFADSPYISEFLEAVMKSTAADFAAVQLYDSANGALRIVAQHGFESELLAYFNTLGTNDRSACNESMRQLSRIVVGDVATDQHFANDLRGLLLQANVRSLESTPLIDSSGRFVGVVSTHSRHPGIPSPETLKHVDDLATSFLAKIKDEGKRRHTVGRS
jgi:DNA-binding NarL/FixJ family response regulator